MGRVKRPPSPTPLQFGSSGEYFSDRGFLQYLCFNVVFGWDDRCAEQQYTEEQQRNYDLIKSLHDGGMRYRKIADYLNEQGIKTLRGNNWKNIQARFTPKKYHERLQKLALDLKL